MSHLLDDNDERLASASRELTLGTGSILAIFFGLALLCALFFGFGYNLGHKSGSTAALPPSSAAETAATASSAGASPAVFSGFKPPASTSAPATTSPATVSSGAASSDEPAHAAPAAPSTSRAEALPHLRTPAPRTANSEAAAPQPAAATPGFFVQVAAVSHPQDASLLTGALRAKGYTIAERSDPADKLIHLQIGPFATKPAAEVTRQRLLVDGYNAIIK